MPGISVYLPARSAKDKLDIKFVNVNLINFQI